MTPEPGSYLPLLAIASLAYLVALFLVHRLSPRLESMGLAPPTASS